MEHVLFPQRCPLLLAHRLPLQLQLIVDLGMPTLVFVPLARHLRIVRLLFVGLGNLRTFSHDAEAECGLVDVRPVLAQIVMPLEKLIAWVDVGWQFICH